MDIGTAKPTIEERCGVPHYLIDIAEPTEDFSVADYARLAHEAIEDINSRGKLPILAGGSGLYINTVIDNITLGEGASDQALRVMLAKEEQENGAGWLHKKLELIDPESYKKLHPNDTRRIIRALEVFHISGETITQMAARSKQAPQRYNITYIGLENERQILYNRIETRVDKMFEAGLEDEVRRLIGMGCNRSHTSMQAIGYKEVLDYIENIITREETADTIKQGTRNYAKRQFTWFRRDKRIKWFDTLLPDLIGECERYILGGVKQ